MGTTGYKGGDTGHGGRTYLRLNDLSCADITGRCTKGKYGEGDEIEIELGGDTELSTFVQSLEFAIKVLKDQIEENKHFMRRKI